MNLPKMYGFSLHKERMRQIEKWGYQHHPDGTEASEAAGWQREWDKSVCQEAAKYGGLTWRHILQEEVSEAFAEEEWSKLREELIQVAAVCLSWLEDGDSRESVQ
jgi:hypothetical protein